MSQAELTRELIKEKGHFIIEAKDNFVPGVIVVPGHTPVSADPHRGLPANPGIVIQFSKGVRRLFDVTEAAEDYAIKRLAAERGDRGAKQRKELHDEFIDETIHYLKDTNWWKTGDIELYRSPEEVEAEAKAKMMEAIPEADLIEELTRKGVVPEGMTQEEVAKFLRTQLKTGKSPKTQTART